MLWVNRNTRHGTHLHALRLMVVAYAFGAFIGVNLVNLHAHEDGAVGALGFTHIAIDALIGDHQSHENLKPLF
jgi:alpha/beta superfamily hydrolase